MTRKKITLYQKINLASIVRHIHLNPDTGHSLLKALARASGVSPSQLRRWEQQLDSLIQQPNQAKETMNLGHHSCLAHIKDNLLTWLSNMRQDGVPVSIKMLTIRATQMLPSFGENKTGHAKYMAVSCLLKLNGFSIQSKTRVEKASSFATRELATQFMNHVHLILALECHDMKWLLNMDQTAMFFP